MEQASLISLDTFNKIVGMACLLAESTYLLTPLAGDVFQNTA